MSSAGQSLSEAEMEEKEKTKEREIGEIEETTGSSDGSAPNLNPSPKSVRTKVPEVEVHLFRRGKGPIDVFKSSLGGWDQDQLEVRNILDKYGLKSLFAFNPGSGRGVPIRFHPRKGRSLLPYKDGSVIFVDGEPKDSLIKPVTKILFGVAVITLLITFLLKETPQWMQKLNVFGGNFPPWILACVVIVFTRMRKRTKDLLKNRGW
ncbi:WD repeat protein [Trema orientale]|uniref:WD repeat protein n=1 Tax=Trema orientale TaxID=63057 RepID=A0A2P5FR78_TREOI|nr:WD repeat protein [Trema orientale]